MGAHVKTRSSRCAFQPRPKKKVAPPPTPRPVKPPVDEALVAHYQGVLKCFATAFADELAGENFKEGVQEVKKALYERDFKEAFGDDMLAMYAGRWSPTRALCYGSVLADVLEEKVVEVEEAEDSESDDEPRVETPSYPAMSSVIAIGGGPAELAAYGSLLCHPNHSAPTPLPNLRLIDSAAWGPVNSRLQSALSSPPILSKYASASARAANKSLLTEEQGSLLSVSTSQADILGVADDPVKLSSVLFGDAKPAPALVTLFFTLNELYAVSRAKTTMLLLGLTEVLPLGSQLLIIDSSGSYSETAAGDDSKKYPMRFLVEHILLREERGVVKEKVWEEMADMEESIWFRLPEGLEYPIQLENMRYQRMWYRVTKPAVKTPVIKK